MLNHQHTTKEYISLYFQDKKSITANSWKQQSDNNGSKEITNCTVPYSFSLAFYFVDALRGLYQGISYGRQGILESNIS